MNWLIATDLDGTLLDDAYGYAEAAAALDAIGEEFDDVAIVLASSKTLAEMLALAGLAVRPPMLIFENGAGFAVPRLSSSAGDDAGDYDLTILGAGYAEICSALHEISAEAEFRFRSFHQMSRAEVAELTGLGMTEAALARRRLASEPLRWHGAPQALPRFVTALGARGLRLQRGGRFYHVTAAAADKRHALDALLAKLDADYDVSPMLIACGDAPNDLELIDAADRALLFPQRDGTYLREADERIAHARTAGPADWLAGVRRIIIEDSTAT
jgi:mannosyl-3-phosphoglycerate phosphatase